MSTPCILSVAITGSLPRKKDNPAVPDEARRVLRLPAVAAHTAIAA